MPDRLRRVPDARTTGSGELDGETAIDPWCGTRVRPRTEELITHACHEPEGKESGGKRFEREAVREVEEQYGILRAQALPPRESPAFVEKLLGET
ncbi:hypothetical protein GCM10009566_71560 [Streptomyces murinus]